MTSVTETDIYRAAHLLVTEHGADAEIVGARRADVLMAREDYEGRAVWLRIMRAIAELQARPSGPPH